MEGLLPVPRKGFPAPYGGIRGSGNVFPDHRYGREGEACVDRQCHGRRMLDGHPGLGCDRNMDGISLLRRADMTTRRQESVRCCRLRPVGAK